MVGYLTDVTGPRLTGSPNLKKAQQYAIDRMREWGIANAHPEAWSFGRGWSLEGFAANMIAHTLGYLIAYQKAGSRRTNGAVRGDVRLEQRVLFGGRRLNQGFKFGVKGDCAATLMHFE